MKGDLPYRLLALLPLFLLTQCKKEAKPLDLGYGYFPSNVGHYCIYQVDSTVYDDFKQEIVTYHYQIKEVVESDYIDVANRETQRLERYYRFKESDPWVIRDIWTSNLRSTTAERYEENIRIVKLVFPVKKNRTWKGNIYNTGDAWDFEYTEVNTAAEMNGQVFDSTLTVLQIGDSSLIEKKDYREMYAKNVGLIYKRYIDVHDKDSKIDFSKPFMRRVDAGFDYTYKIIAYGN